MKNPAFPKQPEKAIYWLLAFAALYAFPFLGGVHLFDWDEVNFAECAREMLLTKDYLRVYISYLPFWEKPPFFIWEQALAMKVLGVNEYAARVPNAITGIITLWVLYKAGKKIKNATFGFWVAACFLGSILPAFYMKSGIMDPVFNLFIFLGILHLYYARKSGSEPNSWKQIIQAGLFTGLAILTKGPVALLITALVWGVFWIFRKWKLPLGIPQILSYLFLALAVPGLWFGIETILHGPWFFYTFVEYQIRLFATPDAGHGGFAGYHFVVLLLGCFPTSILVIDRLIRRNQIETAERDFTLLMQIIFWVVLILFTIVKSKIIHYSSLCYFPISWLAAEWLYTRTREGYPLLKWQKTSIVILGIILSLPPALFVFLIKNKSLVIPYIKDKMVVANLDADLHFTDIEWTISLFYIAIIALYLYTSRIDLAKAWLYLLGGTTTYIFLIMVGFMGRVEMLTQNAVIEWQKELRGKNVYVITYNYKSYAYLFYSDLQSGNEALPQQPDDWRFAFINAKHDRDTYIFVEITEEDGLRKMPSLRRLKEKNGFVMYMKPAG